MEIGARNVKCPVLVAVLLLHICILFSSQKDFSEDEIIYLQLNLIN